MRVRTSGSRSAREAEDVLAPKEFDLQGLKTVLPPFRLGERLSVMGAYRFVRDARQLLGRGRCP